MTTASIGGLEVTAFSSLEDAARQIVTDNEVIPGFAVAVNPEKVMMAQRDATINHVLQSATLRYPDGMGVVKTMAKKGVQSARIPGCELWLTLMQRCAAMNTPVAIIGASQQVNQQTADKLKSEGVNVVFAQDGFFDNEQTVIDQITASGAKVISVAMGSPKQEQLIMRFREQHADAFYMGVGGSYDVYTGHVKRAPALFCKLHLEWFYRLCSQPTRYKRQLVLIDYAVKHFRGQL